MRFSDILNSPSKKLAVIFGAFCFGVLVGPLFLWIQVQWFVWTIASLFFLFLISNFSSNNFFCRKSFYIFLLLIFCIGVFRYTQSEFPDTASNIAVHTGQAVRITGVVDAQVERRIDSQRIILDDVRVVDSAVLGRLLVRAPLYPEISYNDTLMFSCRMERPEPFNGFAYDRYLKTKGVLAVCGFPQYIDIVSNSQHSFVGTVLSIKTSLVKKLRSFINEPHAAFLSGLLFGGSSSLSRELQDDFSRTGTSHILAASGFNVSLFSFFLLQWLLGTRLKRSYVFSIVLTALIAYMIMAGATPAVVRATIMGSLFVLKSAVRRKPFLPGFFLLTAALMLLENPRILLDDPGFQLSFVATASILAYAKIFEKHFAFIPNILKLREMFVASLSAIVFTIPIVLWHFGSISLTAPIVNLIILPLLPLLMSVIIFGLAVSFVSAFLAHIVFYPAWAISYILLSIIRAFSAFDPIELSYSVSRALAIVSGILIIYALTRNKKISAKV